MQSEPKRLKIARYYSSVTILYVATLLFAGYIINPFGFLGHKARTFAYSTTQSQPPLQALLPDQKAVTGQPVRLVISSLSIDLPVDEGNYNPDDQTWTLSAKHAQFAMPSMLANNIRGNTLIYGHYNIYVFYKLKQIQLGATADVYTNNGHVFSYIFKTVEQLKPDDVTVFDYQSYPMLTLQTCTGSFYEYRQMFHFSLLKVDGKNV